MRSRGAFVWLMPIAAMAALAAGCDQLGQDGCVSDDQCKGSRLCSQGVCVESEPAALTDDGSTAMSGSGGAGGAGGDEPIDDDAGRDGIDMRADAGELPMIDSGSSTGGHVPTADEEYICEPGGPGACQNEADCVLIRDGSAKETAKTCGIECATSLNQSCAKDCIQMRTTIGDACAECLDAFFDCILSQCLGPCASGTAEECAQCSRDKPTGNSCSDQWFACSGTRENPDFVSK